MKIHVGNKWNAWSKAANNFFNKQVICQVRDQTWPDKETVWLDKKIPRERPKLKI